MPCRGHVSCHVEGVGHGVDVRSGWQRRHFGRPEERSPVPAVHRVECAGIPHRDSQRARRAVEHHVIDDGMVAVGEGRVEGERKIVRDGGGKVRVNDPGEPSIVGPFDRLVDDVDDVDEFRVVGIDEEAQCRLHSSTARPRNDLPPARDSVGRI